VTLKAESDSSTPFTVKAERDRKFTAKDAVIAPLLEDVPIEDPKSFLALLMPCLWGPEVAILRARGVPAKNLWLIENSRKVWLAMRRSEYLAGAQLPARPAHVVEAVDLIEAALPRGRGFSLIYLDFFGQPDALHYKTLYKLHRLGLIAEDARVLLTFGHNRGEPEAAKINRSLEPSVAARYLQAANEQWAYRRVSRPRTITVQEHDYVSNAIRYTTTAAVYDRAAS